MLVLCNFLKILMVSDKTIHRALVLMQLYKHNSLENFFHFHHLPKVSIGFNPKETGGGGGGHDGPPPRHIARLLGNAWSSRRDILWQFFFFRVFRTFWHQICDGRGYGSEVTYMHVGPKMAPKCDFFFFLYKINANWVFSLSIAEIN